MLCPWILGCDTAAGRSDGVPVSVVFLTYGSAIGAVLITIAGILTPIGLGDGIVPGSFVNATFAYAKDGTAFGIETTPRDNYMWSRFCADQYLPCPGLNVSNIIGHQFDYSSYLTEQLMTLLS